ncbi:hypothetical protein D3C87_1399510 [compost metagenome]
MAPFVSTPGEHRINVFIAHVVGHDVVHHIHAGLIQGTGRLPQLLVSTVAAGLVETVPEVAFASTFGRRCFPLGHIAPGRRQPHGREAIAGDLTGHARQHVVPCFRRVAAGVPVKTLQQDFLPAAIAHRFVGDYHAVQGQRY